MTIPPELALLPPVIMILVKGIKMTGLPTKFLALIALALGAIGGVALNVAGPLVYDVIFGLMAGGSAAGIYDAGSAIKNIKK